MHEKSWWQNIDQRFPWSFFGVILAIVFGVYTVATTIIEKKPAVEYQLISAANVLDLHKSLQDLKIFFRGEDIQEKKKNLKIYTIRIVNVGGVDILESYFDSKQKWGIQFSNAAIVQAPRIVDANSQYLRENIAPVAGENSVVAFQRVIFERGKYFTVEILVMHDKDISPQLSVLGKIAGIEDPQVTPAPQEELYLFGNGDWLVKLVFPILFFIGIVAFIAGLIWPGRTETRTKEPTYSIWIFVASILMAVLLIYVWSHIHMRELEYQVARELSIRESLIKEKAKLDVEQAALKSPQRIEAVAREKLQMVYPDRRKNKRN